MFDVPHFVTGPYTRRNVFLSDEEYGRALDAIVKGCSDAFILSHDQTKVLLGRRKINPAPHWWFIGGRVRPGETPEESIQRNVKRDLGLDLDHERFHAMATFSMVWATRNEEPQDHGSADLAVIHYVRLEKGEELVACSRPCPDEYHELKWWSLSDVLSSIDSFHPCLVQAARTLEARLALENLESALTRNESSSLVADKAAEFVAKWRDSRAKK
jgi:ADP-ribose pyrophosphatase YjhB (NUDIX family)